MKKALLALVLVGFLALPAVGLADDLADDLADNLPCSHETYQDKDECPDDCIWNDVTGECTGIRITGAEDIVNVINKVGNWVFAILLAVAALMLIISAFLFVTAAGDANRVGSARKMLTFALVGVAVGLAARGLVTLITSILGS